MTYLCAQHVRDSAGAEGVSVFVYTHRDVPCPGVDWSVPDVGRVADHCPGKLAAAIRSVTGQGASVRAFLDVVARENLSAQAVATSLQSAVASWPAREWPSTWYSGLVGVRFYVVRDLRDRAIDQLTLLNDALLSALGQVGTKGATPSVRRAGPIVVERRRTPVGYRLELSASGGTLLQDAKVGPRVRSVSVSAETADVHEAFTGRSIEEEAIQALTGLNLDQVDSFAGAVVVDVATGSEVWHSPGASRPPSAS